MTSKKTRRVVGRGRTRGVKRRSNKKLPFIVMVRYYLTIYTLKYMIDIIWSAAHMTVTIVGRLIIGIAAMPFASQLSPVLAVIVLLWSVWPAFVTLRWSFEEYYDNWRKNRA